VGGGLWRARSAWVYGATGIGKTHLGLHFAHAGLAGRGHPGIFFDMNARGDSQQTPNTRSGSTVEAQAGVDATVTTDERAYLLAEPDTARYLRCPAVGGKLGYYQCPRPMEP
jgi:hypothetical protein